MVVTIIVIIILASIVIFNGLSTPESAEFSEFATEVSEFNLVAKNEYAKIFREHIEQNDIVTDSHIYYELATGRKESPNPVDTVDNLGNIYPDMLNGNEYYLIEDDINIDGCDTDKKYFGDNEKHYITDEGEVFILPGYLVEENGVQKWWINENKYYVGEQKIGKEPLPAFFVDSNTGAVMRVLHDNDIKVNSWKDKNIVKMVLKADDESSQVPIPEGFDYVCGTGDKGTVIARAGNEFVWIPVDDVYTMFESEVCELSGGVGVTTSKYGTGSVLDKKPGAGGNREPDVIASTDNNLTRLKLAGYEGDNAFVDFAQDMVDEFNLMIESVKKYGGFYIGRFELGYDNGMVCRGDVKAVSCNDSGGTTHHGDSSTANWYGLYNKCKSFTTNKLQSGMIWGCQIDAIKDYTGTEINDVSKIIQNGRKLTGQYNDIVKNIHDLRGNMNEWTMLVRREGGRGTIGGNYSAPNYEPGNVQVTAYRGYLGTRPYLFIK